MVKEFEKLRNILFALPWPRLAQVLGHYWRKMYRVEQTNKAQPVVRILL